MTLSIRQISVFYVALSGLLFGLIGYFGMSAIHQNMSVYTMLFWRFLVSALVMGCLLLSQLSHQVVSKKDLFRMFCYGGAMYGMSSMLYFIAAQYIGTGLAMVLFFTYPAIVMILNLIIYKQAVSQTYYLAIVIIIIGMLCLIHGSAFQFSFTGIVLSLLSSLLYASYLVMSKNINASAITSTFTVCGGAAMTCLIAVFFDHSFLIPKGIDAWINIFGIALICTSLPILLLLKGLKHIGSLQASIISVSEPVFVVLFGILLLGEVVNITQCLGVGILLLGALLSLIN